MLPVLGATRERVKTMMPGRAPACPRDRPYTPKETLMSTQSGFVVIAEFIIQPDQRDVFLEHAHEDARQSLANEHGCHQFDVLVPEERDDLVVLHEVYSDRAAFDAHTRMPHYQPFKDSTAPLLASQPVVRFFVMV